MKKLMFLFCLTLILEGAVYAAPYRLDEPLDAYSWGESREQVKQALASQDEYQHTRILTENPAIMVVDVHGGAPPYLGLAFYHGALYSISNLYLQRDGWTREKLNALYNELGRTYAAQWGDPQPAWVAVPKMYQASSYSGHPSTLVVVSRGTGPGEDLLVSYRYADKRIDKDFEREMERLGTFMYPQALLYQFESDPDYAKEAYIGLKIRLEIEARSWQNGRLQGVSAADEDIAVRATLLPGHNLEGIGESRGKRMWISGLLKSVSSDGLELEEARPAPSPF